MAGPASIGNYIERTAALDNLPLSPGDPRLPCVKEYVKWLKRKGDRAALAAMMSDTADTNAVTRHMDTLRSFYGRYQGAQLDSDVELRTLKDKAVVILFRYVKKQVGYDSQKTSVDNQ